SPAKATIATIKQTKDDKQSVDFEATGKKDVGEKATGTVNFSSRDTADIGRTIPAGTELSSSSGKTYLTDSSVTMNFEPPRATASVSVTAAERGTNSNGASGSLSGAPGNVNASLADSTSGGTDKTITIVTKSDIANAKKELNDKDDDEAKTKLKEQFASSVVAIDESFTADSDKVSSSPAVGDEASNGQAKLTSTVTYTMYGIDKNELDTYLNTAFDGLLDGDSQRVYDTGSQSVEFSNFTGGKTPSIALQANGKIGPKIKEDTVKEESRGQVYGDIQSRIGGIDGVQAVDVKFFPFWVSSVPDSVNKITVEFKLADD
ncbi:MAG: baseplate J/gp47 family protein, partial [bacterium]|nr:baseplate J/gp47 family protein [bacterium]